MGQKTALYHKHLQMGGKLVDFAGWDMPVHYGSQKQEHLEVRRAAGMFDVSHMTVVDVKGGDARDYLRHLLANDVARLKTSGRALYTAMLNEQGGVIDDLIVYLMGTPESAGEWYRMVVNCATRKKDLAWMSDCAARFEVALSERPELAMIAVQGPQAISRVQSLLDQRRQQQLAELRVFQGLPVGDWFFARTGYTGEDGLEIMLPEEDAPGFWQSLADAGVVPCGLGARDTLRLEAGLNLYGAEMDEHTSPLAANMGWTLAWEPEERDFIGRQALASQRDQGCAEKLVGLILEGKGVLRAHQPVIVKDAAGHETRGVTTSGSFAPSLGCSIALARVPAETGTAAEVEIRGRRLPVKVVTPGFVRKGKPQVQGLKA